MITETRTLKLPKSVYNLTKMVQENGFECYLVGGSVRDFLLNHFAQNDFDFTTNATPEKLYQIFSKLSIFTVPTGLKHGTITVVYKGENYEFTTYRIDGNYNDNRHPEKVSFTNDLSLDLSRRDFTINAIAYDPTTDSIIDPFLGKDDLNQKLIKAVGDPNKRFEEDALRMLRACRFASTLNFTIEEKTLEALKAHSKLILNISKERIHDEIMKIMKFSTTPSIAIRYMQETDLLKYIIPELLEGFGEMQNEFHLYSIYEHLLHSCDSVPKKFPLIRLAALFHDIGKSRAHAYAKKIGNGDVFYNHEIIGAQMSKKILERLKFSKKDIDLITKLVEMHMFHYTTSWSDGAVRRFLRKCESKEFLDQLFILRRADRLGSGTKTADCLILEKFRERLHKIIEQDDALKIKDLDINGNLLMKTLDLQSGPIIGQILNGLLENVLEHPEYNQKEKLLSLAAELKEGLK